MVPSTPLPETTDGTKPSIQRVDPLVTVVEGTPAPALPSDSPLLAPAEPPLNVASPPGVASEAVSGAGLKYT